MNTQQSTVEERLSNLLHEFQREFNKKDVKFNYPDPLERRTIKNRYVEEIKSEIHLAEQKAYADKDYWNQIYKIGFTEGRESLPTQDTTEV